MHILAIIRNPIIGGMFVMINKADIPFSQSKTYGYVRVSSESQSLARQIAALTKYNVDPRNIISDKSSGKDFERPGFQTLKTQLLRSGDTLVVKELDRLGRNYSQIREEWSDLLSRGINIEVIDMPLLNTTNKGNLEKTLITNIVFELLSYVAERERKISKQRQAEGIASARAKGVHLGRPKITFPTDWKEVYITWSLGEITAVRAMEILNLKRTSFYKLVRLYEEKNNLNQPETKITREELEAKLNNEISN